MALLKRRAFLAAALAAPVFGAGADGWTEPLEIYKGKEVAVRYRARLSGDIVWVEATHGAGWHTYSLDNKERAAKKAGGPVIGVEKPTVIAVQAPMKVAGKWRQSKPKDLSQPEMEWYTWGFEEKAIFAAKLSNPSAKRVKLVINAQACKSTQCAIVDDAEIVVPRGANGTRDAAQWGSMLEAGDLRDVR